MTPRTGASHFDVLSYGDDVATSSPPTVGSGQELGQRDELVVDDGAFGSLASYRKGSSSYGYQLRRSHPSESLDHPESLSPKTMDPADGFGRRACNPELVDSAADVDSHDKEDWQARQCTSLPQNVRLSLVSYYSDKDPGDSDWLDKPEVPDAFEIASLKDGKLVVQEIELEVNKLKGPWTSKEHYLRAQYRLMREDTVSTLRDAVEEMYASPMQMEAQSGVKARIYERVYISGVTLAAGGIAHRLDLSTGRAAKRISWARSKRLKTGTLVAMTPVNDMFKSKCFVGVVAARPLAQMEAEIPAIDVYFSETNLVEIDTQIEYVIIEASNGYFEACRHTLQALQHMAHEQFPMSEHLVKVEKEVSAPLARQEDGYMNISSALTTVHQEVNIDILSGWPQVKHIGMPNGLVEVEASASIAMPTTNLDESQFEALRRILTKRLAIVQGPPGTGKTHVSVIALRVLLENRKSNDPPIIVTAQTNHALDQLLRHIRHFAPDFIRLGGQTQDSEVIEPHTLYNIKARDKQKHREAKDHLRITRKKTEQMARELKQLLMPLTTPEPFHPKVFFQERLITADQYKSLVEAKSDWVGDYGEGADAPIGRWARGVVTTFEREPPRTTPSSMLDVEDEDIDQLKDIELEKGVVEDDDKDNLWGAKFFFHRGFRAGSGKVHSDSYVTSLLRKYEDLNSVPNSQRGIIYNWLQHKVKDRLTERFRNFAAVAKKHALELKIAKAQVDAAFLKEVSVIGLTTTGVSKYRGVLASLQPKIVLIEEAAETQEAYVTATCFESLDQLILVGDHQQLQAHCQNPELEEYHLNVSLFERLVLHNEVEFQQLSIQRRMIPEMRQVLNVIYPALTDHPCVEGRGDIPGMGGINTWFMHHETQESIDEQFSWQNEEEAHLVVGLFEYLVRNGTSTKDITILTFYNGQRRRILSLLRKSDLLHGIGKLSVNSVDSYQGEENEVIILSLVRNNDKDRIGFLSVANRVCVALSRARRGFYMFGNYELLSTTAQTDIWRKILNQYNPNGKNVASRIDRFIPLKCVNHGEITHIRSSMDWDSTDGGCQRFCHTKLDCGHKCLLYCHPEPHEELGCFEHCKRILACGHLCGLRCIDQPCQCKQCEIDARKYQKRCLEQSKIERQNVVNTSTLGSDELLISNQESYIVTGSKQKLGTISAVDSTINLPNLMETSKGPTAGKNAALTQLKGTTTFSGTAGKLKTTLNPEAAAWPTLAPSDNPAYYTTQKWINPNQGAASKIWGDFNPMGKMAKQNGDTIHRDLRVRDQTQAGSEQLHQASKGRPPRTTFNEDFGAVTKTKIKPCEEPRSDRNARSSRTPSPRKQQSFVQSKMGNVETGRKLKDLNISNDIPNKQDTKPKREKNVDIYIPALAQRSNGFEVQTTTMRDDSVNITMKPRVQDGTTHRNMSTSMECMELGQSNAEHSGHEQDEIGSISSASDLIEL